MLLYCRNSIIAALSTSTCRPTRPVDPALLKTLPYPYRPEAFTDQVMLSNVMGWIKSRGRTEDRIKTDIVQAGSPPAGNERFSSFMPPHNAPQHNGSLPRRNVAPTSAENNAAASHEPAGNDKYLPVGVRALGLAAGTAPIDPCHQSDRIMPKDAASSIKWVGQGDVKDQGHPVANIHSARQQDHRKNRDRRDVSSSGRSSFRSHFNQLASIQEDACMANKRISPSRRPAPIHKASQQQKEQCCRERYSSVQEIISRGQKDLYSTHKKHCPSHDWNCLY